MVRDILKHAELVVIKVGSKVLLEENGRLNYPHIAHLVEQIALLHKAGRKIIFVSSGAIVAGMEALNLKKRPSELPMLQTCAAIGQVRLMRAYEDLFGSFGVLVGQVLLTHDDVKDRARHLNIKHTLHALLEHSVIPIINENDTVAVDEIKFGDNDVLASLVAMLLEAKALVLLTTAQGFMITNDKGEKEKLSHIIELNNDVLKHVEAHKDGLSKGGMESKIKAAANMNHVGGLAIIAPGTEKNVLHQIFAGFNVGTVVGEINPMTARKMPGRKRWIAFYHKAEGALIVDDGAKKALCDHGKSLLAVGITDVKGHFAKGSVVEIRDQYNQVIAKGICQMADQEVLDFIKANQDKKQCLSQSKEVVHRDNLVMMRPKLV